MRRAVVLLLLLGLMAAVSVLQANTTSSFDPLTLASIGFVVLASFSAAEVGVRFGLPRVTGYIVSGLLLGPSALNILSTSVVDEMQMFNTLALGLIAMAAGLELDIAQIKRVWRTLAVTVTLKIGLATLIVGGAAMALHAAFGIPGADIPGAGLALAVIFAALALGTSPAIVLAVLRDGRSSGRLSDLVLGAAVFKDVVVVVMLAVAVAIAGVSLGGGALDSSVFVHVAQELGASALAGTVLGLLLIGYIRFVHSEMLLFVSAMVLIVAEVALALHLELLLVFITAGFVVRNFSRHEHDLAPPLEMVSLPVFIVFFTIAGASVDLTRTLVILPFALALVAARTLAFWLAARIGGRVGGEPLVIVDNAFLAYLPQAGVTLGLIGIAAQRLPLLADPIQATGTAVVAVHLLLGPIALRTALSRAGELDKVPIALDDHAVESPSAGSAATDGDAEVGAGATVPATTSGGDGRVGEVARVANVANVANVAKADVGADVPRDAGNQAALSTTHGDGDQGLAPVPEREALCERVARDVDDLELAALLRQLISDLDRNIERAIDDSVRPWATGTTRSTTSALGIADDGASLRRWAQVPQADAILGHGTRLRELFNEMRGRLRALPVEIDLTLPEALLQPCRGDTFFCRLRRLKLRLRRRLGRPLPRRRLPLRLAARMVLEPRLAAHTVDMLASIARAHGAAFEALRAHAAGHQNADDARRQVAKRMTLLIERLHSDARHMLLVGVEELAATMQIAGGPQLPLSDVRYSIVESKVRDALRDLADDPAAWRDALAASQHATRIVVELAALRAGTELALERHLVAPAAEALGGVRQVVIGVRSGLYAVRDACSDKTAPTHAQFVTWADATNASFAQRSHRAIETRLQAFRAGASIHRVALELRGALAQLPEGGSAVHPSTPVSRANSPSEVLTHSVDIRVLCTEALVHGLLSEVDERLDSTSRLLANTGPRLREAVDVGLFAVESRLELAEPSVDDGAAVIAAFERAIARVDRLEGDVGQTAEGLRNETRASVQLAIEHLNAALDGDKDAVQKAVDGGAWQIARRQVIDWTQPVRTWWHAEIARLGARLSALRESRLGAEFAVRTRGAQLDAAALASHVRSWQDGAGVSDAYARLFALQPVREHRLFTANHRELEQLRSAEREWIEGRGGSVLLIGDHGSGRTSLLNMLELELTVPRVLRPDPVASWRESGLDAALAAELGCLPQRQSVLQSLRKVRTAVLVDDLERWFTPDDAGLRALAGYLDLIQRCRESVFWVMTTSSPAMRLLEEAISVRPTFAHVVVLAPLDHVVLQQAIEARHLLSGRTLTLPHTFGSQTLGRLLGFERGSLLFRVLARSSGGNLTRAMVGWLRAIESINDFEVRPAISRTLTLGLPPFATLDPIQLAMLVAVLRFGGASPRQLSDTLGVAIHVANQHAGFLRAAGLLEANEARRDELRVPRALVGPVILGLRGVGTEP